MTILIILLILIFAFPLVVELVRLALGLGLWLIVIAAITGAGYFLFAIIPGALDTIIPDALDTTIAALGTVIGYVIGLTFLCLIVAGYYSIAKDAWAKFTTK